MADNPSNPQGDVARFVAMIMRAMAQSPCEETRNWILKGIQLAYTSKNIDKIIDDMSSLMQDGTNAEEIMQHYAAIPMPSQSDVDSFSSQAMLHIDTMVFEGRPMPTGPTMDNPLGGIYEMSDMASFMRVFARWLNEYMKMEGE